MKVAETFRASTWGLKPLMWLSNLSPMLSIYFCVSGMDVITLLLVTPTIMIPP